jgi:ATP-dependent RNA helicase SUPV3L1/SUV3
LYAAEVSILPISLQHKQGSYSQAQPGDCIIAFTRPDIFAIKREIEKTTPYKCCVIYGTLPPLIRAEQARLFNDPTSKYEILIASDAIGMGLNLSIKRIIFHTLFKNNGEKLVKIDHSLVKQIAGRAGRRNSPYPHGEVTCRNPNDLAYLKTCMETEIEPIKKAGKYLLLFSMY